MPVTEANRLRELEMRRGHAVMLKHGREEMVKTLTSAGVEVDRDMPTEQLAATHALLEHLTLEVREVTSEGSLGGF